MTTPDQVLHVLCAGAAQGLVKALAPQVAAELGVRIEGRFGAVGAMKEALLAGEPCDVMIVTDAMIETLAGTGELEGRSRAALGRVRTGVAVKSAAPPPEVGTSEGLRATLLASDRIYFPDPLRATAGIHFADTLRRLGLYDRLAHRFATFASGAIAMRELAASTDDVPIGCTQITEILYTEGVQLAGALPPEFELATGYTAAVAARSAERERARRFVALLSGEASRELRRIGGFEVEAPPTSAT